MMSEISASQIESFYVLPLPDDPNKELEFHCPPESAIGGFVNDTSIEVVYIQSMPDGQPLKKEIVFPHGMNIHGRDSI